MSAFSNEVIVEPGSSPLVVDGSAVTQPVSGSVSVSNFPATQPVSGTVTVSNPGLTDTQLRAAPVPVVSTPVSSNSSAVSQVTSTGANQTLVAANASRKKVLLHFTSGVWYVKYGATASATSRTYVVNNTMFDIEEDMWKGPLDALCTTSGKLVDITDLV